MAPQDQTKGWDQSAESCSSRSLVTHSRQRGGYLFRIAHNEAMDFLRRRARYDTVKANEDPDMMVDPAPTPEERVVAAASLRTYARLPVLQRSAVILMDVLGYSIEEIGGIVAAS